MNKKDMGLLLCGAVSVVALLMFTSFAAGFGIGMITSDDKKNWKAIITGNMKYRIEEPKVKVEPVPDYVTKPFYITPS